MATWCLVIFVAFLLTMSIPWLMIRRRPRTKNIVTVACSPGILLRRGHPMHLKATMISHVTQWPGGVVLSSGPFQVAVIIVPRWARAILIYRLQHHFPYALVVDETDKPLPRYFKYLRKASC